MIKVGIVGGTGYTGVELLRVGVIRRNRKMDTFAKEAACRWQCFQFARTRKTGIFHTGRRGWKIAIGFLPPNGGNFAELAC